MLGADHRRAAPDEELRHLVRVQVVAHRERVLGADRVEDREHAFLFDELLRELDRLDRVVLVVLDLVDDLAPVDAAVRIDVVEVRLRAGQRRLVLRLGAGEWRPLQLGMLLSLAAILVHGLVDVPYFKNDLSFEFWALVALTLAGRQAAGDLVPRGSD